MKKELKIYNGEIIGTTYDLELDSVFVRNIGHVFSNSYYHDFMEKIKSNRVSNSLKDKALVMIREAILINSQEECQKPIYLNYVCFGLGAPDSYDLLEEYYSSLYECCLKQKDLCGISKGVYGKFYKKPHLLKSNINRMKVLSLLTTSDMLLGKSGFDMMKDFKLSLGDVDTLYSYLEKVQDEDKVRALRVDTFKRIYHEVIDCRNMNFILDKYQIKFNKLVTLMRNCFGDDIADSIVSVKKQEDALSLNNQRQQFEEIARLIFDGINNPDMLGTKFTALDYFAFSRENPSDLFSFMSDLSYEDYLKLKPKFVLEKEKYYSYKGIVVKNLLEYLINFGVYNKDKDFDYFTKNNGFITTQNGKKYFLTDYIEQIFELFDKKAIPKSRKTVEVAFYRLVNKLPIFPFEQVFSNDKNILPTSDKLKVCNGYIVECSYDVVFDDFVKLSSYKLLKKQDYFDFLTIISNNKVSDDLKNKALTMIREAISINNQRNCQDPVCLNYVCFSLGAPDSYDLVGEYYNSLYNFCLSSKKIFGLDNGIYGEFYKNDTGLKARIDDMKILSLITMMNTVLSKDSCDIMRDVNLSFEKLNKLYRYIDKYREEMGLNKIQGRAILDVYNNFIDCGDAEYIEENYQIKFKTLVDYVRNDLGEDKAAKMVMVKKRIDDEKIQEKKSVYKDISKIMIENWSSNFKQDGASRVVKFSILDYCSKTTDSPFKVANFLKKIEYEDYLELNTDIVLSRRDYYVKRALIIKNLMSFGKAYDVYIAPRNYEDFVRKNIYIATGSGDEYYLNDYLDEIFRELTERNVPCSNKNVEIAFLRIRNGIPILPFEDEEARGKVLKP